MLLKITAKFADGGQPFVGYLTVDEALEAFPILAPFEIALRHNEYFKLDVVVSEIHIKAEWVDS